MARMVPHLVQPLPFCVPTYRAPARRAGAANRARHHRCGRPRPQRRHRRSRACSCPAAAIVSRDECLRAQPAGRSRRRHRRRRLVRLPDAPDRAGHPVRRAVGGGRRRGRGQLRRGPGAAARRRRGDRRAASRIAVTGQRFDIRAERRAQRRRPVGRDDCRTPARRRRPAAGGAAVAGDEPGDRPRSPAPMPAAARRGPVPVRRCRGATSRSSAPATTCTTATPTPPTARTAHVAALLADAQRAFPRAGLTAGGVRLVHRGLLPMVDGHGCARQAAERKPGGRSRRRRAPRADLDLQRALHHRPPHRRDCGRMR